MDDVGSRSSVATDRARPLVLGALVTIVGVVSGLGAAACTWVLHEVEKFVYGHGEVHGGIVTDGVARWRSSLAVLVVSIVLAVAWWLLRGRGRPLAGVAKMVAGQDGPVPETWANAVFQMVGVGAGLPVGREVAPREVAAMMARRLCRRVGVAGAEASVVVGAAAGAGLGAVYQVPVAGAVYAVELLIGSATTRTVAICLATSAIAVVTSRVVVSPVPQYAAVPLSGTDWHLLGWAVVIGVLLGIPGRWFGDLAAHVKKTSQRGPQTLLTLPVAGLLTAGVGWFVPLVLGNGRSAAQAGFLGASLAVAVLTVVGKCLVTLLTLRAGAVGGTLAPAIAVGSMTGVVIGRLVQMAVPGTHVPVTALAVLGAVAVLATSLRAPLAGLLLVAGVTGQPHEALLPMAVCVGVAWGIGGLVKPFPHTGGRTPAATTHATKPRGVPATSASPSAARKA